MSFQLCLWHFMTWLAICLYYERVLMCQVRCCRYVSKLLSKVPFVFWAFGKVTDELDGKVRTKHYLSKLCQHSSKLNWLLMLIILHVNLLSFISLLNWLLHTIDYQVTKWVSSFTNILVYGMYRDLAILCVCPYDMAKEWYVNIW